jgi:hypothetical protein
MMTAAAQIHPGRANEAALRIRCSAWLLTSGAVPVDRASSCSTFTRRDHFSREAYDLCHAGYVLFTMTQSNDQLKAAQVRWELNLSILQEEERRLFGMLEEQSRESATVPQDVLDRLKAARSQCNDAFKLLMGAIEDRVTHVASTQAADRQDDAAG